MIPSMENQSRRDKSSKTSDESSPESNDESWESNDESSESSHESSSESGDESSPESSESNDSLRDSHNNDDGFMNHDDRTGYHSSSSVFQQYYRCHPITDSSQKYSHLENSDKIVLPESALDRLSRMNIQYPMSFELRNPRTQKLTHCGVMEFTSEEGLVLVPDWMMQKMSLEPGEIAVVKNVDLVKGTYVKLRPHTSDFLQISNPKSVLETTLRSFSCLTAGDTIMIVYNGNKFYIDVLETRPATAAISIIETDCEVSFAPPLDYKERERPVKISFNDVVCVGGKVAEEEEAAFRPFVGVARRLDGNPVTCTPNPASRSCTDNAGHKRKTVLGSREAVAGNLKKSKNGNEEGGTERNEEKGFQAFTGRSYRLTD